MQLLAVPQNTKSVRPQSIADGLGDGQCRCCRNGGIDCVAALEHHAQSGLCCQGVRCGDHIACKQGQACAAVRGIEIESHTGSVDRNFAFIDDFFPFGRFTGQHARKFCRRTADSFNAQLL